MNTYILLTLFELFCVTDKNESICKKMFSNLVFDRNNLGCLSRTIDDRNTFFRVAQLKSWAACLNSRSSMLRTNFVLSTINLL